jgi:hypothetical protein
MKSTIKTCSFCGVGIAFVGVIVWYLGSGAFVADATGGDNHYKGTVMSTEFETLMIETAPDKEPVTFRVDSRAQILKDGQRVRLEEIAQGDTVSVDTKGTENERVATMIEARSPH